MTGMRDWRYDAGGPGQEPSDVISADPRSRALRPGWKLAVALLVAALAAAVVTTLHYRDEDFLFLGRCPWLEPQQRPQGQQRQQCVAQTGNSQNYRVGVRYRRQQRRCGHNFPNDLQRKGVFLVCNGKRYKFETAGFIEPCCRLNQPDIPLTDQIA